MTHDEIIKLAQSSASVYATETWTWSLAVNQLAHFAHLVASAEREACAKVCEDEAWRLKKQAVDTNSSSTNTKAIQASNDADAIRARGTP